MFSFRANLLAVALCLAGGLPASAANCDNSPNSAAQADCLGKELRKADAELNVVYQKAMASLLEDAGAKANLLKSERAWLAYKDSQCNGVVGDMWTGGSQGPISIAICDIGLIKLRIRELVEATREGG